MHSVDALIMFLGWSTVINFSLMVLVAVILVVFRDTISVLHAKMYGLEQADVLRMYFAYLGNYKIAIFMLNLVPYIVLKIMT